MIVYLRESKFGKIEVLSAGLSYVLLNGEKLKVSFYDDEKAIKFAGNDSLIAKSIKDAKNTSFGDFIMSFKKV
jgi:hypothetical protein